MYQGMAVDELATELLRQRETKIDYRIHSRDLEMDTEAERFRIGDARFGMVDTMHESIAGKCKIPKKWYDRLRLNNTGLLSESVNWALREEPAKVRMVRTLDNNARALVGPDFWCLDNGDLAEFILPLLQDTGCEIRSCAIEPDRMYLKATTARLEGELRAGQWVRGGVVISNSEIGRGSLRIQRFLEELVCTNGMVAEVMLRQAHVAGRTGSETVDASRAYYSTRTRQAETATFFMKAKDTVQGMLSDGGFEAYLGKMRAADDVVLEDPFGVGIEICKDFSLIDNEKKSFLSHLSNGGRNAADKVSGMSVCSAITRTAQDASNYTRATELEGVGSRVIDLNPGDWMKLEARASKVRAAA